VGLVTNASRPRLYYGWWIVVGAGAGHFASVAFASILAAVVMRPMTEELGWTRAEFTFAISAAAILAAFTGVVVGPLIDRYGARPLMLTGALAYGAALFATSLVTELWQFVALHLAAGILARPLIGGVVVNVAVAKWFVVRRGWAISLASSGFSFGTMLMPPLATAVVASLGWRDAFVVMALLFWALMVPAALLMRRTPEDYGMLPDGRRSGEARDDRERRDLERVREDFDRSYTRRDAMRTQAFWLLLLAFSLFLANNIAMLFHAIPFATGTGFTPPQAGFAFGLTGISGLLSKFVWGWALERASAVRLSALAFGAAGGGTLLLLVATDAHSMPALLLAFFAWGFGFGGVTPLSEYLWASYFGRRHLGAVRSLGVPAQVAATSLGPLLVALWFDLAGSYEGAFVAMVAVYAAGAATVLASRPPPLRADADAMEEARAVPAETGR
jgi:OFA family oxalate/formate antiporter-like MFS transporter